jgi:hypothetical protein
MKNTLTIFNRPIRLSALGFTLYCFALFVFSLGGPADTQDALVGAFIGGGAITTAITFTIGWITRCSHCLQSGFLMSALLTFAYSIYTLYENPNQNMWLTMLVSIIAIGAFLDERSQANQEHSWTPS